MNFLELCQARKSCRKYSTRPVGREAITRCLEAARLAPSACNSQPWRFIVVADPALKNELAQKIFSGPFGMNSFAKAAPVLVLALRENSAYMSMLGAALRGVQYSLIDLGIACEHFILQAAAEGLGTCWLGWFDEGAAKKVLNLPRSAKIDVVISLGYPQDPGSLNKNRKAISEMSEIR